MRRMHLGPVTLVAVLAAVLSAVVAGLAPAAAAPTVSRGTGLPSEIDYVALGDSYSAAPLVPGPPARPALRTDPLACARSWNNYPAFLAGYLRVRTYTDVTCSGADTDDLTSPQGGYVAPQTAALSADTDLVTVGIGGNDYGLFGSLIDQCGDLAEQHPHAKAPCQRHFTVRGVDTKLRDAHRIRARVASALSAVRAAAPNAAVWVVAYPRILPASGTCDNVGFSKGDAAWGNRIELALNRSLRRAATDAGASYAPMYAASRGHDACSRKPWINGKDLVLGGPTAAADFHPMRRGTRGVARTVYAAVPGVTAPAYWDARPLASAIVTNPPYAG